METKYRIIVSEPWDYENREGKNLISGIILRKISNRCLVFQSSSPLVFKNATGNLLVLFPRFKEETFDKNPNKISVNGGLLPNNFIDSSNESNLEKNSKFVIIGSLENTNMLN